MLKKIFYIGNDTDFWASLFSSLIALQYKDVKQYQDENLGSIAFVTEHPDIAIFDCENESVLKHAQDVFSYPESKNKVFFRGPLAPVNDIVYKPFCLVDSSHEREDIAIHENTANLLQKLGLLS